MQAVICTAYGPPSVLKLTQIEIPKTKDHEILIKVMATAVNSGDVRVRGLVVDGYLRVIMRLALGIKKPRKPILGTIASGVVVEIGDKVTAFKPGDEVFASSGFKFGAYAQYMTISEEGCVAIKPQNASFEEAAAILFGGMTATYFLEKAGIAQKPPHKVLIYGATGSVGTAAIAIAKYYQAHVTSVCSEQGRELATLLQSDAIHIYTREDVKKLKDRFDIIFDAIGKTKKADMLPLLKKGGKFCTVGGLEVAKETKEQMAFLKRLFEVGAIKANIDKTYGFHEMVAAHEYVDKGRKKGNVVVRVNT